MGKLRTFEADEEAYDAFKVICDREKAHIGEKINEFIKKYVKEHGDGNPIFELDKWFGNSQMKAVPAVFRTLPEWQIWIDKIASDKEFREIESQIYAIKSKLDQRWEKGF